MKNTKLQNPSLRKRKGFTLIELIVVIAILAILAAIAIPTFLGQLNKARINTHNANVMSLRSSAAVAVAENGVPGTGNAQQWTDIDGETGTVWAADQYIDTYPSIPAGLTFPGGDTFDGYTVDIGADGIIDVTPGKLLADGTDYVS